MSDLEKAYWRFQEKIGEVYPDFIYVVAEVCPDRACNKRGPHPHFRGDVLAIPGDEFTAGAVLYGPK